MEEQTLRDEIRKLISRNKTEDAFELLSSIQFSKEDKQLIVLNSQYNRIKEELRLNVISKDEGERRINQINMALLDISNKMMPSKPISPGYQNSPQQKQSFNPKLLLLLLIPLAAFLIYSSMSGNDSQANTTPIEKPKPEPKLDPKPTIDPLLKLKQDDQLLVYLDFNGNPKTSKTGKAEGSFNLIENHKGQIKQAVSFPSNNSRIKFEKLLLGPKTDYFSIVFWVKPQKTDNGYIYGQYVESNAKNISNNFCNQCLAFRDDNMFYVSQAHKSKGIQEKFKSQTSIPKNIWTHIAFVREGNKARLYINGLETPGKITTEDSVVNAEFNVSSIGRRSRGMGFQEIESFSGSLDEFYLFDRSLSNKEVQLLYKEQN